MIAREPLGRALTHVRAATTLARARPAYAAGLRAAIATVAPLAVDYGLRLGGGTWMSLAGFSGALADKGGPYRTRAATLAALTAAGAVVAVIGALAAPHPLVAVPLALLVAALASLGRAYGNAGASVGGAALSIFVISLGYPSSSPHDALVRGAFVVVGGVWAMAVALVIWPLRPYRPVRLAVAGAYRAVGDYADEVARSVHAQTGTGPLRVRAALEQAQAALATVRRGRPGESGRGERLVVLGEVSDQLFGALFGLSDVVDTIPRAPHLQPARDALAASVTAAGATARAIAAATETENESIPIMIAWSGDAVRAALPAADTTPTTSPATNDDGAALREAAALLDRAAQYAAVGAATVAGLNQGDPVVALERPREVEDAEPSLPLLAPLRATLASDSVVLRYALRVGLVTALAVALVALLGLRRGYWVTLTAVLILQPYTGATTQRALQRVLGTVVGGALTAILAALFHHPLAILALAFVFSGVSVALLPLNYAAFSVFLTPTFVLLAEAGAGDWHLAGLRIVNTVLGGLLALAGSRLLWPSPETERLPAYLADVVRAIAGYFDETIARFDDRGETANRALRAARRHAGLAILNADASFQRLLGEHRGPAEDLGPLMTLLTYSRRLTASVAALALSRHSLDSSGIEGLSRFADGVRSGLGELAQALSEERLPPPFRELALPASASPLLQGRATRLVRQLRSLHDAVERWQARREPVEREGREVGADVPAAPG